jgi:adenylate cyclase
MEDAQPASSQEGGAAVPGHRGPASSSGACPARPTSPVDRGPPPPRSAAARAQLRLVEAYRPRALAGRLWRGLREAFVTGGVERRVTVMFTDIVGFTGLTAGDPPRAVAAFLNDHFALVTRAIEAEAGTIDKFIGDAVMAFWAESGRRKDHAARAARAALGIAGAVRRENARRIPRGAAPVRVRIGLHTGPVIAGGIGSPSRMGRTIIGETVNMAQRLEQLGKRVMTDEDEVVILVGESTAAELGGCFPLREIGPPALPHRLGPMRVFALGRSPASPAPATIA